jgi:Rad3-related DNA helicase
MSKLSEETIELPDGSSLGFLRVPSYFPKENQPIIYLPVADFSKKSADEEAMELMIRVIDSLLDKHQGEKGLIHAVSYSIARYIVGRTRHQNRIISHSDAETRGDALEQLITSEFPLVLVSPSFGRGVDLYGDRARFQICVKIPFPDLGDKQTSKRRWSGKGGERWYLLETVRAIVQMAGRIVRSSEDWGATYIFDERWPRFYRQMQNDFPPWFREATVW